MIHELARSWGWMALRGVLAILFGVVALSSPASAFAAIVLVFGAYAFVDGVFALVALFRGAPKERFWVLVFEAIVGIGIGILTIARPAATTKWRPSSSMKFLQHDQFSASLMSNTGPTDSQP